MRKVVKSSKPFFALLFSIVIAMMAISPPIAYAAEETNESKHYLGTVVNREYVAAFGAASFAGHELTGVCGSKRLNVVPVTLEERSNTTVPLDWYVLEQANIDGIVLWQDRSGAVYQTAPHIKPRKFCGSLAEYIEL